MKRGEGNGGGARGGVVQDDGVQLEKDTCYVDPWESFDRRTGLLASLRLSVHPSLSIY